MRTTNRVQRARLLLVSNRYKVELGRIIKARREHLGLTQKELAELTHYKEGQTVSRWERGENLPSDLQIVASALQWTLPQLVAGLEPPDPRTARKNGHPETPSFDGTPNLMDVLDRLERIEQKVDALSDHVGLLNEMDRAVLAEFHELLSQMGRDIGRGRPESRGSRKIPAVAERLGA